MNRFRILFIILPGILYVYNSVSGQENGNLDNRKNKSWSVCLNSARFKSGGPAKDLENAMNLADFDVDSPGYFGLRGAQYPTSNRSGHKFTFSAKYMIKPPISIGFFAGNTDIGNTSGRAVNSNNIGQLLNIEYSLFCFAPIISVSHFYDGIRIGIGPAIYYAEANKLMDESKYYYGEWKENYSKTKPGFLIEIGIRIPDRSHFFGEFLFQFRKVGKVEVGPYNAVVVETATLPKTKVSFDHTLIGYGIGFRL